MLSQPPAWGAEDISATYEVRAPFLNSAVTGSPDAPQESEGEPPNLRTLRVKVLSSLLPFCSLGAEKSITPGAGPEGRPRCLWSVNGSPQPAVLTANELSPTRPPRVGGGGRLDHHALRGRAPEPPRGLSARTILTCVSSNFPLSILSAPKLHHWM